MKQKHKLGLALSGGGARGFAHLGVLKVLNEKGLRPDLLSGTSAGALAGVFYADGYTPKETLSFFKGIRFGELATTSLPRNGFFKMDALADFLAKHLRAKTFEELQIPLRVVASDIETGESIVFEKGELIPPVLASCAFPIVFEPVKIDGRYLVDGGLFKNLPVSVIRKDCEKVIGVNVSPLCPMAFNRSFKYVIERSLHYLMVSNVLPDRDQCDYLIESFDLGKFPLFDLRKSTQIYKLGYEISQAYFEENKARVQQDFFAHPKQPQDVSLFTVLKKLFVAR